MSACETASLRGSSARAFTFLPKPDNATALALPSCSLVHHVNCATCGAARLMGHVPTGHGACARTRSQVLRPLRRGRASPRSPSRPFSRTLSNAAQAIGVTVANMNHRGVWGHGHSPPTIPICSPPPTRLLIPVSHSVLALPARRWKTRPRSTRSCSGAPTGSPTAAAWSALATPLL